MSKLYIWCWIIPLFVGTICAYFGYLIGLTKKPLAVVKSPEDYESLKLNNSKLEAELLACTAQLKAREELKENPIISIVPAATDTSSFNALATKLALGKVVKENDLKIIEGIGPKIEGLFHNYNIKTWEALSNLTVANCYEILHSGGDRYKLHDPASWPMQAKMAFKNKWKELARWQKEHKSGKL